jgi:hypothetical protein
LNPPNAPSLAAPDPVADDGLTPLCRASTFGLAKVAAALLHGGAKIEYTTPTRHAACPGFTPLMFAAASNHAVVAKLLLKRGADGTKLTTARSPPSRLYATSRNIIPAVAAGSTALDIAHLCADSYPICAETLAVLRLRCCSTCGLSAMSAGNAKLHLKRCGNCPARGPRARYCSEACQCADWVPRHRGECAEARRARQAAGTEA